MTFRVDGWQLIFEEWWLLLLWQPMVAEKDICMKNEYYYSVYWIGQISKDFLGFVFVVYQIPMKKFLITGNLVYPKTQWT